MSQTAAAIATQETGETQEPTQAQAPEPNWWIWGYNIKEHPVFEKTHWEEIKDKNDPRLEGTQWCSLLNEISKEAYERIFTWYSENWDRDMFFMRVEKLDNDVPTHLYFGFTDPAQAFIVKSLVTK